MPGKMYPEEPKANVVARAESSEARDARKKQWALLLIAALGACDPKADLKPEANGQEPDPQGLEGRVLAGETKVCSNPAVIRDVVGRLVADNGSEHGVLFTKAVKPAWEQERDQIRWSAASALDFKQQTHELTCRGTLEISDKQLNFTFALRPSVNNRSVVYKSDDIRQLLTMLYSVKPALITTARSELPTHE